LLRVNVPRASIEYEEMVLLAVFDVNAVPLRVITTQHGAVFPSGIDTEIGVSVLGGPTV
jgi:hypothetical protein